MISDEQLGFYMVRQLLLTYADAPTGLLARADSLQPIRALDCTSESAAKCRQHPLATQSFLD